LRIAAVLMKPDTNILRDYIGGYVSASPSAQHLAIDNHTILEYVVEAPERRSSPAYINQVQIARLPSCSLELNP